MQLHRSGAILVALQACAGAAAAFSLLGRQVDSVSKIAKPNDGGDATTLVAYSDGVCQKPLDKTAPNGGEPIQSTFKITETFPHVNKFPAQNWNPAQKGSGKPDTTPASGWNVFFSVKKPDPGCRVMVFVPHSQERGPASGAPGIQIINAGAEGCFYASLQDSQPIMMSKCCGKECTPVATLNNPDLQSHQLSSKKRALPASTHSKAEPGSVVARASAQAKRFLFKGNDTDVPCKLVEPGTPYTQAGDQVVIQNAWQQCTPPLCNFAAGKAQTYTATVSSSHTDTTTNTFSHDVSLELDASPLGIGLKATNSFGYSYSKAQSDENGQSTATGNQTTFTATSSGVIGEFVAMTYTPTYTCHTGKEDCGEPNPDPKVLCIPNDLGGLVDANSGNLMPMVRSL